MTRGKRICYSSRNISYLSRVNATGMQRTATLFIMVMFLVGVPASVPANKYREKSLDVILNESSAIVFGTVVNIDGDAFEPTRGPQTRYTVHIEEVLHGAVRGNTVTYTVLGGNFPDSDKVRFVSTVPELALGEAYILAFKSEDYTYHPFVEARTAVLREVRSESGHAIFTDREGFLMNLDEHDGLWPSMKVALSDREIRSRQRQTEQSVNTIFQSAEVAEEIEQADSADEIKQFIRWRSARSATRFRMLKSALSPRPYLSTSAIAVQEVPR
jgi:hypothetical protein